MTPPHLSRRHLATLGNPRRPGRQHQTPALAPTMSRRHLAVTTLGATLMVSAAACGRSNEQEGSGVFGWIEGDKPLAERQTIEDYQATVETQLALFVQKMQAESGGATLLAPSKIRSQGNGEYRMTTAIVGFDHPVSYTRARELAEQLFPAVGLTTITNEAEDSVSFHDEPNGGFVSLGDNHERGIAIYGTSGSRPSTQADPRAARVTPDWEAALPLDPSVDPTSTSTPAPPTKS